LSSGSNVFMSSKSWWILIRNDFRWTSE
jgi:hypothetical protein